MVFAATKEEKNEICQEISETTTVKADCVCSKGIHRNEQVVEATMAEGNQYCKAVLNEPPDEKGFTSSISNRDKEQLVTNDLVICDGSEATLDELFKATDAGGLKHSEKQNAEQDDGLKNKTDVHDETKAQNFNIVNEDKGNTIPVIDNSLEEKPALIASAHPSASAEIRKQYPGVILTKFKNPGDSAEKPGLIVSMLENRGDIKESYGNSQCHDANPAVAAESRDHDSCNTFVQELRTIKRERKHKTLIPKSMELKQPTDERAHKEAESDKCDALVPAFSGKAESTCEEENKVDVEYEANAGLITRTVAFSEQASNTGSAQDISVALHSRSLDNLRLYHQQESAVRAWRPSRVAYSPPANPRSSVGHLTREKRPPRMLRRESFDVVCRLH